eukprot:TRINITY_DN16418_c1_g2_i3.p2 TRINITY_DN16418_c1_g2~~TRINITY_DN16418_c1_g2_i3.p2  ORF type:complete len:101 (+),score=5.52 TRINITY_DN16418_c1_g2_i3:31-303(+)
MLDRNFHQYERQVVYYVQTQSLTGNQNFSSTSRSTMSGIRVGGARSKKKKRSLRRQLMLQNNSKLQQMNLEDESHKLSPLKIMQSQNGGV